MLIQQTILVVNNRFNHKYNQYNNLIIQLKYLLEQDHYYQMNKVIEIV